MLMKLMLFID